MLDMLALVALSPWLERVRRRRRRRRLPPPRDETDDCREPSSPVKPPDDVDDARVRVSTSGDNTL